MWNSIQCAVQGRGHVKENIPCQDKTYALHISDIHVIALADGAGSARLSHLGAEYVTRYMSECLADSFAVYFNEEDGVAVKRKIVNNLKKQLGKLSKIYGCEIRDFASTLLLVAIKGGQYILIHIGDGVIGYLKDDELKIASQPENGEFANTTVFTTSQDVLHSMKILKGNLGNIEGFILMSDGSESSLYNKKEKVLAPILKNIMFFSRLLHSEYIEEQLKESFETIIKQATMDDCSIAMLIKDKVGYYGYNGFTVTDKEKLFGMSHGKKGNKRKIRKMDMLLKLMENPCSLTTISRKIHLKKKYTKRYLQFLLVRNLIIQQKEKYKTAIIMQK